LGPDLRISARRENAGAGIRIEIDLESSDGRILCGPAHWSIAIDAEARRQTEALYRDLQDVALLDPGPSPDLPMAVRKLDDLGAHLGRLLPGGLADLLWHLQGKCRTLQIVTDDPWIPWELLRLRRLDDGVPQSGQFLAEVFAISRWLPDALPQISILPCAEIGVVRLAAEGLSSTEDEIKDLIRRADSVRNVAEAPSGRAGLEAQAEAGCVDAWHFAGHGPRTSNKVPDRWQIELANGDFLSPDGLSGIEGLGRARPLVFFNACAAARTERAGIDLGGWPARFISAGAAAFLGPHFEIPDRIARTFSNAFYNRFLEGRPLAEAVRGARLYVRKKFHGHPAWLAFAVWGNPLATVGVRPKASRSAKSINAAAPASAKPPGGSRIAQEKAWTGCKEHGHLSWRIASDPGEFQRIAERFFAISWAPPGVPLRLGHRRPLPEGEILFEREDGAQRVVRFLAFVEGEHDLGPAQAERAAAEVRRFAHSPSAGRVDAYVLALNRPALPRFRGPVLEALRELQEAGAAPSADLWDPQRILRQAFNAVLDQMLTAAMSGALSLPRDQGSGGEEEPIEHVPLRRATLIVDQHRLRGEQGEETLVADPAQLIAASGASHRTLLLGDFGYGKTTALERSLASARVRVLYVQAASLAKTITGAKDLLAHCVDLEKLTAELSPEDVELYRILARPTLERLLKEKDLPIALVLDGVDESAILARSGGFQQLCNALHQVRIPFVLAMRTEFWLDRRSTFEAEIGSTASHGERQIDRFQLIELTAWGPEQIGELVARYGRSQSDPERAERVARLAAIVGTAEFDRIYGDIPKRPLFLRFIVDSVAEVGLPGEGVGRARLFADWAERKIRRDLREPRRFRDEGRGGLTDRDENDDEVIQLAWEAMIAAARSMSTSRDGKLELEADCDVDVLLASSPRFERIAEPLRLCLFSLLRPSGERSLGRARRVRFGHRAYQEFFLAWSFGMKDGPPPGIELPETVRTWLADLEREGLP